jgi:hypothetical protein
MRFVLDASVLSWLLRDTAARNEANKQSRPVMYDAIASDA